MTDGFMVGSSNHKKRKHARKTCGNTTKSGKSIVISRDSEIKNTAKLANYLGNTK